MVIKKDLEVYMVDYNKVVLVDENDNVLGEMDKLEAHTGHGVKHRAISVMLFREKDGKLEVLIQKRSNKKPLWPQCWDATCSTHPVIGESYEACTVRRLREEVGIVVSEAELEFLYKMSYQADYNEFLAENEMNAILIGKYDGEFEADENEVEDIVWADWEWVKKDVLENENNYAVWFVGMMKDGRFVNALDGKAKNE